MRYTQSEKIEIIRLVEESDLPARRTLRHLGIPKSTFYRWYRAYAEDGADGLAPQDVQQRRQWNQIPESERETVVEVALAKPELSPRGVAWHVTDTRGYFISESSVYRILKAFDLVASPAYIVMSAKDKFDQPTRCVHEMWQTDFTYFKIVGWGWYYLLTVLDDYSRFIIDWKLFGSMTTDDVTELLDSAIEKTGVEHVPVRHRPRLLSDNGPCFVSKDLQEYMAERELKHTRGRPYHPQTQGKIERYHRTMKNVVKLKNYYLPCELEQEVEAFVQFYNHERVHESLKNLTPADVYEGRDREIQTARDRLKKQTLRRRKRYNLGKPPRKETLILPSLFREGIS